MVSLFFHLSVYFHLLQTVEENLHMLRGSNSCDHVHCPMVNLDECPEELWRSVLLQQICQSSTTNGGNLLTCVQDGHAFHSGTIDTSGFRVSSERVFDVVLDFRVLFYQFLNNPCSRPLILVQIFDARDGSNNNDLGRIGSVSSTVQMASHMEHGVVSNGSKDNSKRCNVNENCWRALFSIIDSQKFVSLCKLLSENFRGIKADNVFDFSLVNSRINEGAYENSPTLFLSDVQQAISCFTFYFYLYFTFLAEFLVKHFINQKCLWNKLNIYFLRN